MDSEGAEVELPKLPIPWRIYLLIGLVALLIAGAMGYLLRTGNLIAAKYAPLVDAAMEIKLEATRAHLWLEEALSGDRQEDMAGLWRHLDESVWYARAMLEGGQNPEGTFIRLKDPQMRREIEEVLKALAAFRAVAERRRATRPGPTSRYDIHRRYHAIYADLIRQADDVETRLQQLMRIELTRFRAMQVVLIVACVALAIVIAWILHRYDRRRAEDLAAVQMASRRAQRNEKWLSTTLESMGDGVIIADPQGVLTYINPAAATLTGWDAGDARGRDVLEVFNIVNEETGEPAENPIARVIREKHVVGLANHTVLISKDGGRRPIADSGAPILDDRGDLLGAVLVFQDITERKRAEQALQEGERFYRGLLDDMVTFVGVLKPDGEIIFINNTPLKVGGITLDDVVGKKFHEAYWFQFSEDVRQMVQDDIEQCASGKTLYHPMEYQTVDGSVRWVGFSMHPIRDEAGTVKYLIPEGRDITDIKRADEERRRLEARMQQAQKLESLGILAGGIAHDFNNLLTGILGNADLALMDLSPVSPARENIKEIQTAGMRAADLSRQMLAYSGKGRFVVEAIDLSELVTEMGHLLEVSISKNVVLKYDLADNLPAVEADATQIRQVIMNLITNASEAIGDKSGVVSITTGAMECDRAYLRTTYLSADLPEGIYVTLEVADTGCGMDAETLGKIFDPFFTTKFAGRGLGLAAVLGIVRGHNGAQKIYSEPGKGTTFKVLLPASDKPLRPLEGEPTQSEGRQGTGTILLVDDEETVRAVGRRMLETAGFTVLTAENGREALDVFQEHADEIVCVLLDLTMPHMGGEETFRELRRVRPGVRVFLSSGYNEEDVTQRFAGKGLAGFIQKPYRLGALIQKLKQVLES